MGWWKKLKRGVKKAAKKAGGIAKAPITIQAKALRRVGLGKVVNVSKALAPTAMRYAAGSISTVPGLGTAGGAALAGAASLAQGRSLRSIAQDAAIGAVPGGAIAQELARSGVGLTRRLVSGQRLDRALVQEGRRAAMRQAKRYLGGVVSSAVPSVEIPGMTDFRQAIRSARPLRNLTRPISNLTPFGSLAERTVIRALEVRPSLVLLPPAQIASELGLPIAAVRKVLDGRRRPTIRWRPVSSKAAAFVRQHQPFARFLSRGDASGLAVDGKTYTIEEGDTPGKVAEKLTGKASRYTELFAANPTWPTVRTTYGKNFKYFPTGRVMKLPESWWPAIVSAPPPAPSPGAPTPVSTPPVITLDEVTAAEILKSKAILAVWSKTAGTGAAGLTDYGSQPSDGLPTWGARDKLMLASFARWRGQGSTDGEIRQVDVDLLSQWAESAATQALPPVVPASVPAPTPAPAPVPQVSIPDIVPSSIPSMTLPGGVTTPSIPIPTTIPTTISLPAPAPTAAPQPAPPSNQTPPTDSTESSGGGAALAIAALAAAALLL